MREDLEPPSLDVQGGFTNKVHSSWTLTLKWLVDESFLVCWIIRDFCVTEVQCV